MPGITTVEMLQQTYAAPVSERARWKEIDHINDMYRAFIEASPFLILSTHGENGVDCSPRGDPPGFVRVASPQHTQIPDRRGNNRHRFDAQYYRHRRGRHHIPDTERG